LLSCSVVRPFPPSALLIVVALVVFITMAIEARRAARNELAQLARGGVEPRDDVYTLMRFVYPLAFVAMLAEGAVRGLPSPNTVIAGAVVFVLAKTLKWWAILSLGPFWTFRVIVVRGTALIVRGPYRWLRHPNYVAVMGEIAGVALLTAAVLAGVSAMAGFGLLLMKRIAVEERALSAAGRPPPASND
jgi:methyltransferase